MSIVGPFSNSNIEVMRIQDHARRGAFGYFCRRKAKVTPGTGKAHRNAPQAKKNFGNTKKIFQ
jgi:hypothetical protein